MQGFRRRVVFRPCNTLRQLLTKVKTPTPDEKKAEVIYEIPCLQYIYIRQFTVIVQLVLFTVYSIHWGDWKMYGEEDA